MFIGAKLSAVCYDTTDLIDPTSWMASNFQIRDLMGIEKLTAAFSEIAATRSI